MNYLTSICHHIHASNVFDIVTLGHSKKKKSSSKLIFLHLTRSRALMLQQLSKHSIQETDRKTSNYLIFYFDKIDYIDMLFFSSSLIKSHNILYVADYM